jgi:hypothetical protein
MGSVDGVGLRRPVVIASFLWSANVSRMLVLAAGTYRRLLSLMFRSCHDGVYVVLWFMGGVTWLLVPP